MHVSTAVLEEFKGALEAGNMSCRAFYEVTGNMPMSYHDGPEGEHESQPWMRFACCTECLLACHSHMLFAAVSAWPVLWQCLFSMCEWRADMVTQPTAGGAAPIFTFDKAREQAVDNRLGSWYPTMRGT